MFNGKIQWFSSNFYEICKKQRKIFKPISIIYKPTKCIEIELLCYFSNDISKAYTNLYSKPNQIKRAYKCYQCYYCNTFFNRTDNCSGVPEVIYNFNNQNLISYRGNFHTKRDIPFIIYFHFETTAPTDYCLDPEQKKIFVVSYVMIVAFHPELEQDRIVIQRSYSHSIEQLTSLNYFTQEQINFLDHTLIKMLKDMAFDVSKRKCKNSMGQMFCIESALVKKTLLKWFNKKYKQQFVQLNPIKNKIPTTKSCKLENWQMRNLLNAIESRTNKF